MVAREPDSPGRLHWIDWIRVAAIAGVFAYHTLRPFNTAGWHVKNAETIPALDVVTSFFDSFGMAVLFLLAGSAAWYALRKRTASTFVRERTTRLLVPFIVGTLVLSPLQAFLQAVDRDGYAGSFASFLGVWVGQLADDLAAGFSPVVFGVGYHLWFLGFLFAISVAALPVLRLLGGDRGRRAIESLAGALTWRGSSMLAVVPIFGLLGIGSMLGTREHDWFEFAWYLGYFVLGFVLVSDPRFLEAIRRDLVPALVLGVATTGLIIAGVPVPLGSLGREGGVADWLAVGVLFATEGWSWTIVILNVGLRLRRLQRPVSERLGDAVLPVYVIHQPVILAVAFLAVRLPADMLIKWAVVFGVSLFLTVLLVELALRTRVTRMLLGTRVRAAAARRSVPGSPPFGSAGASPSATSAAIGNAGPR